MFFPGHIHLRDRDEISFSKGKLEDVKQLSPSSTLCNPQYAVAHTLCMSSTEDVIVKPKDDADDQLMTQTSLIFILHRGIFDGKITAR
jgi:hypothetical protein